MTKKDEKKPRGGTKGNKGGASGKSGRKPTISDEVAEEMFGMYLAGISLQNISTQYEVSVQIVQGARKRGEWDKRRQSIEDRVLKARDDSMVDQLVHEKKKQLDMMGMIFDNLYKDILSDHQNRGTRGYRKKLELKNFGDVEKFIKTYFLVVNGGVAKTENENTDTKVLELKITDEDAKTVLKGLVDGSVKVKDDIKPGNA